MRRIIKPFAVETRRAGRKPAASTHSDPDNTLQPAEPPRPLFAEDESYREALRAADAFFGKSSPEPAAAPAVEPQPAEAAPQAEPQRRILQSLTEEDPLSRLLAEAEARPRRGRKPRGVDALPPLRRPVARAFAPAVEPTPAPRATQSQNLPKQNLPARIPGYVRGLIYARYARHDEARPGEQWRKRSTKPLW